MKSRQANLELLRIICMIYVVTLHFLIHGGTLVSLSSGTGQFYIYWFVEAMAIVAVNCYVLISGYFLVESKFKLKKLLSLWGQVLFYSVGIYVVLVATGQIGWNVKELAKAVFPVLTVQYWFVTMYMGLYVLVPFLNRAIKSMSQACHLRCIIVLSLLFSVWATICPFSETLNFGNGRGVVWFIVLYFVAGYLRLYYRPEYRPGKYGMVYIGLVGLIACSKYFFTLIYELTGWAVIEEGSSTFYNYNSILVYPASVALLLFFLNMRIREGRVSQFILKLAPLTFGVYLIHDNNNMRGVLWRYVDATAHSDEWYFLLYMIGVVLAIYSVCSVIEKIRQQLFKKINESSWLENMCKGITSKVLEGINNLITK